MAAEAMMKWRELLSANGQSARGTNCTDAAIFWPDLPECYDEGPFWHQVLR
jgi:hypothetical protein